MKHKKFTMILLLFLGVFFLQSSTMVFADMADSKETDVAVELWETIASDKALPGEDSPIKNQPDSSNIVKEKSGIFPQTGEIMSNGYSWIGVVIVLFAGTLYYLKKIAKGRN
ncbi:LPXTG cell wall anchor domain-containing protein [Enterococcus hirae]